MGVFVEIEISDDEINALRKLLSVTESVYSDRKEEMSAKRSWTLEDIENGEFLSDALRLLCKISAIIGTQKQIQSYHTR